MKQFLYVLFLVFLLKLETKADTTITANSTYKDVIDESYMGDFKILSTPSAQFKGIEAMTENNKTFYAFLGIPYAQPPIGNLRFRAPLPVQPGSGVYDATKFGNLSLQMKEGTIVGNEDCLFINVYTTHIPDNKIHSPLPVLVWIHGGGFLFSPGNLELHGADRFLDQGLLVVSLNYRLGAFGFLSFEDNVVPGNYGIKDQVLALQWVKKNIASFGGDPELVTIFSESAGAASVHYLRQAKRAKNLFKRVIAHSGNTLNPWSVARVLRKMAFKIGLVNEIWAFDSETLIEGLRRVDALQLQKSTAMPALIDAADLNNGFPFAPCLEEPSEEAVHTKFSFEAQKDGDFNFGDLLHLHGFNSLEARELNNLPWFGQLVLLEQYNIFPSRLTPLDMNASNFGRRIVGQNIRSYYFQNRSVSSQPGMANGDFKILSTPNGQFKGVEAMTENSKTFYAFMGIPYAQPPIGNLRFRAPLPIQPGSGVYDATKQGNQCFQTRDNTILGNEDCLFINVYSTHIPDNNIHSPLPVLVWIHGGGFMYFSGDLELHGADRFLDQGLLVVSLNYRLGAFGFLSTEDNVVPGNYGIKDQVLALQWVRKNIASFGGDPELVTIFGQSAGSASVHYLRQATRAKNLFKRVIANSGNTLNPWSISRDTRQMAFRIGLLNGVLALDSKTLVEGLRRVDATQLQRSTTVPTLLDGIDVFNGLPFAPCLEEPSEEAVYTKFSFEAQEDGDFNFGDLLHGFNSLEGRDFVNLPWYGQLLLLEQYNIFPSRLTPLDMNASNFGRRIVGQNIRSYYFQNRSVTAQPGIANYFSDNEFVRGIVKSTVLESRYTNVYLYRFSFTGGNVHTNTTPEGVSHAEELQFLWMSPPEFIQHTPEARLTTERMVQMWSNFVKSGNPTYKLSTAVNVAWPLANATGGDDIHYLDIGNNLVSLVNPQQEQMQFWENQYSVYGYPPYNTY